MADQAFWQFTGYLVAVAVHLAIFAALVAGRARGSAARSLRWFVVLSGGTFAVVLPWAPWLDLSPRVLGAVDAAGTIVYFASTGAWIWFAAFATHHPWLRFGRQTQPVLPVGFGLIGAALWPLWGTEVFDVVQLLWLPLVLFVLVASVQRFRTTRGNPALHRPAKAYLAAFAIHDTTIVAMVVSRALVLAGVLPAAAHPWFFIPGTWIVGLAFAPMLLAGLLSGALVDFDRKLHFGVSKTTIAAIFIAVFVGIQTLVSEYLSSSVGLTAGAVAAGVLVFALAPLQRMADRIADKTVPAGRSNIAMSDADREAFYRDQVEIAYEDGNIRAKERQSLKSVRERLGISADVAMRIEDAVAV